MWQVSPQLLASANLQKRTSKLFFLFFLRELQDHKITWFQSVKTTCVDIVQHANCQTVTQIVSLRSCFIVTFDEILSGHWTSFLILAWTQKPSDRSMPANLPQSVLLCLHLNYRIVWTCMNHGIVSLCRMSKLFRQQKGCVSDPEKGCASDPEKGCASNPVTTKKYFTSSDPHRDIILNHIMTYLSQILTFFVLKSGEDKKERIILMKSRALRSLSELSSPPRPFSWLGAQKWPLWSIWPNWFKLTLVMLDSKQLQAPGHLQTPRRLETPRCLGTKIWKI